MIIAVLPSKRPAMVVVFGCCVFSLINFVGPALMDLLVYWI